MIIGGAALNGGRGTVRGTLVGAFVIGFLVDGLLILDVSTFWQILIKGAVIIFAVLLDQGSGGSERRGAAVRRWSPPGDPTTARPSNGRTHRPRCAGSRLGVGAHRARQGPSRYAE